MESCLLSSRIAEQKLTAFTSPAQLVAEGGATNPLPLMFPTTPTIKMNDVISSLLQYKADLCNAAARVKSEPPSPLYSPPAKVARTSSSSSSSNPTSPSFTSTMENIRNILPGNQSLLPGNQSLLPSNQSLLPSNQSLLPSSNSLLPSSSGMLPISSSSLLHSSASLLHNNPGLLPSNCGLMSSSASNNPLLPSNNPLLSSNNPLLPSNNPLLPSNNPLLPSNNPLLPSNNPLIPTSNRLLPISSTPLSVPSSSSNKSKYIPTSIVDTSSHPPTKQIPDSKKEQVSSSSSSASVPTSGAAGSGAAGVKIFQTKQGYTLLICNGYRYSKISTSSNGKKVYWRCTLRSCKGKVHTDVGGGVVYESTHDHPPMAEEFLFSCHSNRLAKEARQIMRFDPLKSLKDEVPYSALESTPTFCKIKDRVNLKKSNSSPVPTPKAEEAVKPVYPSLPLGAGGTSPLPTLNIDHTKEGTLSVHATTSGLLTELNTLRLTHHLCDVALCVNGSLIYAHRVVLAAASQYFRLLFLTNTKLLSYIELSGVDADSVELLVSFAYTGNLSINYSRVTDMLTAANLLHFTPVVDKCCQYLRSQITAANCIRFREYVATQGLTKLQTIIDKFICSNWSRVIDHEEIYDARPETLLLILGNDDLQVANEAEVYKVIITWVRKSPLYRQFYVGDLLRKVRLVQLNPQFLLDNIESEELVRQHRECESLLHQAKNHFLLPERDHGLEDYHFRKRKRKQNVCLLGSDKKRTVAYEYDTCRNTAWEMCSTELNRTEYCLLNSPQQLHVIGGIKEDGTYSSEITSYNFQTKTWETSSTQLKYPRSQACGTSIGTNLYIIGGIGPEGPSDKVEVWDTVSQTLSTLPPLLKPLSGAGACVLEDNIYVIGGRTADGASSDSVFVLNSTAKLWKSVAPTPQPIPSPGAVMHNVDSLIYVQNFRYDPVLDSWEEIALADTPPSETLTSTCLDGNVFAMRTRAEHMYLDKLDGASLVWSPCCTVDLPLAVQAMCPRPLDLE